MRVFKCLNNRMLVTSLNTQPESAVLTSSEIAVDSKYDCILEIAASTESNIQLIGDTLSRSYLCDFFNEARQRNY